ncbi:MAG: hypothetical protein PHQ53_07125 [Candidatus Krumholzibacteria bacterium]|nr:hypothetical protein [Candidatus Krumholzibacteria bacterium]
MNEGMPARAFLWGLLAAGVLIVWPWCLGWMQARRPGWFSRATVPTREAFGALWRCGERESPRVLLAWTALAGAAALLPLGNGWQAADLDAGLLWLLVLAVVALTGLSLRPTEVARAAGGLLTLTLCLAPLVLRTAGLHLGDLGVAQVGGVGNWFLLRDPFLLAGAAIYLCAVAALWPAPPSSSAGDRDGLFAASLRAGLPLVLAHLFTVAYLGAWWAFVPALDGLTWLQTGLKTAVVLGVVLWLRRCPAWSATAHLAWRLPLAALGACVGAAIWLAATGAAL